MFVLLIVQWNAGSKIRHSLAFSYLLRISGLFFTAIQRLLFQPIFLVLLFPIWCSTSSVFDFSSLGYDCLSNTHIAILILSLIVDALLIILTNLLAVFCCDEQPDSKLPWAYSNRIHEAYKIAWKVILSFFLHIAKNNTNIGIFASCASLIISGLGLYELNKQTYMNEKSVYYALITSEICIMWFSVFILVDLVAGVNISHPIFFAIGILIVIPTVIYTITWSHSRYLTKGSVRTYNSACEVETYFRIVNSQLKGTKENQSSLIDGAILLHSSLCNDPTCSCHRIIENIARQNNENGQNFEDFGSNLADDKSRMNYMEGKKKMEMPEIQKPIQGIYAVEYNEDVIEYMKFQISEIQNWIEIHDRKAKLFVYLGYLKLFCYQSPLAALYDIMSAQEDSIGIYDQYHIHRLLYILFV